MGLMITLTSGVSFASILYATRRSCSFEQTYPRGVVILSCSCSIIEGLSMFLTWRCRIAPLRFISCHSWLSARTWIRPCIFASSMCNSVVRLKGKRSHTAFLATLPFLGVELPLFSRERAPICLRAKESIASPNASAMCVVPEPGESTKKALSPYTIWSSSRLSTSLQNSANSRVASCSAGTTPKSTPLRRRGRHLAGSWSNS
mmetsp:Transcript_85943/g.125734  ORF Transcript_85943/g.125734 Transcript_85943/m.125734 type:complete len:203 (+) Transcript_85943:8691-9299(+)